MSRIKKIALGGTRGGRQAAVGGPLGPAQARGARRSAAGVAATLSAAVLWGTSFSVNDIGLAHLGPGTFAFLRFAVAGAVVLGVLAAMGRAHPGVLRHKWFWGLCVANALAFLLQYGAQTMTTPARTALFVNTSAFTVALLERALFGMLIGSRRWIAIALGFLGAAMLIVGSDISVLASGQLFGDVLAMFAGGMWSVYFVFNDRAVEKHDVVNLTAWTFVGTATVLAFAPILDLFTGERTMLRGDVGSAALAVFYSGIVTTALAFGLWAWGLTRIRASVSAVLLMVEILVASLVSIALGRETFGWWELVGGGILVAAVVMASLVARADSAR